MTKKTVETGKATSTKKATTKKVSAKVTDAKSVTPVKATVKTEKKAPVKKEDKQEVINAPVPEFSESDKERYDTLVEQLRDAWQTVQKSTLQTSFITYEVYTKGLYKIDGFKNIYEFGADMFGQSKSTVNRLINIVDRFGERIENGKPVQAIDEKYNGYSQSQLEVMLGHSDEELKDITPEMSVREISKKLKEQDALLFDKDDAKTEELKDNNSGDISDGEENQKGTERAVMIHTFENVEQWDNILTPDSQMEFNNLLNVVRACLKKGHKVVVMDVFETE